MLNQQTSSKRGHSSGPDFCRRKNELCVKTGCHITSSTIRGLWVKRNHHRLYVKMDASSSSCQKNEAKISKYKRRHLVSLEPEAQ